MFYPYPFTTNNPRQVAKAVKDLFYPHPLTTNNPRQVAKVAKIPQKICLFLAALRLVRGIPIVFYTHIQNPLSFKNLSAGGLNPCAHVGRDSRLLSAFVLCRVSIHAPTWGATFHVNDILLGKVFQSTRPRGARRAIRRSAVFTAVVSIHAPTWGATEFSKLHCKIVLVSIHAPTWGATKILALSDNLCKFQSTRPRGARRQRV